MGKTIRWIDPLDQSSREVAGRSRRSEIKEASSDLMRA